MQSGASLVSAASSLTASAAEAASVAGMCVPMQHKVEEEAEEAEPARGTLKAAYLSIVMACLGAGFVLTPGMMAESGIALASVAMFVPAANSMLCCRFLISTAEALGKTDIVELAAAYSGPWLRDTVFVMTMMDLLLTASSAIAFSVETAPVGEYSVLASALLVTACLPIKDTERLKYVNCVCLLGLVATVALMVKRAAGMDEVDATVQTAVVSKTYAFILAQGISLYGVENMVLSVYYTTARAKRPDFVRWALDPALVTVGLLYIIMGGCRYLQYGDGVGSNVLSSLGDDLASKVAQCLVAFSNALRMPMFGIIVFNIASQRFPAVLSRYAANVPFRTLFHAVFALVALGAAYGLGSVGKILGLIGGTVGLALCQQLPAMIYVCARREGAGSENKVLDVSAVLIALVTPIYAAVFAFVLVINWDDI